MKAGARDYFAKDLDAVRTGGRIVFDGPTAEGLLHYRRLLGTVLGVVAGIVLAELPGPEVLGSSGAAAAYAGLNPRQHQSGTSINRPARISKIGNAVLRTALYMPALSAMRYNPAIAALVDRLKAQGRLTGKQIVVAAMRKLLVICFGVLKSGKEFEPAIALGQ